MFNPHKHEQKNLKWSIKIHSTVHQIYLDGIMYDLMMYIIISQVLLLFSLLYVNTTTTNLKTTSA